MRRAWLECDAGWAVSRQCVLAGVSRSRVYTRPAGAVRDELDLRLLDLIDEQSALRPCYGNRRMVVVHLREQGYAVNRKRVQRRMRVHGLSGMAPGPATSRSHPAHKIYPSLLQGLTIVRPNQVWSSDITDVQFAYLVQYGFAAWFDSLGAAGPHRLDLVGAIRAVDAGKTSATYVRVSSWALRVRQRGTATARAGSSPLLVPRGGRRRGQRRALALASHAALVELSRKQNADVGDQVWS